MNKCDDYKTELTRKATPRSAKELLKCNRKSYFKAKNGPIISQNILQCRFSGVVRRTEREKQARMHAGTVPAYERKRSLPP